MLDRTYIRSCRERCLHDLTRDIVPFWMKHGVDKVNGGVYTCVDRDGTIMDTTKSVWFQGRFGYIASALYTDLIRLPEIQ